MKIINININNNNNKNENYLFEDLISLLEYKSSKLIWYKTEAGRCQAKEFLREHSKPVSADMARLIYKLENQIPFKPQENGYLEDGIYELRVEEIDGWYRLTYFYPGDGSFVILSGFKKKSNKTPQNELDIAKYRKQDYLKRSKNGKISKR